MKKTILILSLLLGTVSAQAFQLSKASSPSILKSPTTASVRSCSNQCYYQYINCQNHNLPSFICNSFIQNCLLDCPVDNGPPTIGSGCGGIQC